MRNIFTILALAFLAATPLKSLEKGLDSFVTLDPLSPIQKTRIDFNGALMTPVGLSYFIMSPRISAHLAGDFDTNFGIGIRKPFVTQNFILGYHVFYDLSMRKPMVFHQTGLSGEFLTDDVDVRMNYYHPMSKSFDNLYIKAAPHKWVEAEILWKFHKFCVGVSPIYNLTTKMASFKPKVVLPFSFLTIEAGIHLSQNFQNSTSYISTSIPLYSMGVKPVGRASSVQHVMVKKAVPKKIVHRFTLTKKKQS